MQIALFTPISLLLSFTAMFGVFIHDSQIYGATTLMASEIKKISNTSTHKSELLKTSQHAHTHSSLITVNNTSQQTSIQPRNDNDKKYLAKNRTKNTDFDNSYYWPSI